MIKNLDEDWINEEFDENELRGHIKIEEYDDYDDYDEEEEGYSALDIESLLVETLYDADGVRNIRTFDEAGLMTRNKGVVLYMDDGSEFQIQINGSW